MTEQERMIEKMQDWTTKKDLTKGWILDSRLVLVKMAFIGGWQAAKQDSADEIKTLREIKGKP